MIAVVDYGMGNLRSMAKALEHVGAEVVVSDREEDVRAAERIVLPGVGAFGEAMSNLQGTGLVEPMREEVVENGKPFLGVCLGMQLLADASPEYGEHAGLGWIAGRVKPLPRDEGLRIPHTGWTEVETTAAAQGTPLAKIRPGEAFYFTHSFHLVPVREGAVAGRAEHGAGIVAAVAQDNIVATQFHPEKSQQAGLELLAAFADWSP